MARKMINQQVFLLLGSNLGDREAIMAEAIAQIETYIAPIQQKSTLYETASWGITEQPSFLNQVVAFQTTIKPQSLLQKILAIEKILGRERLEKWGSRTIDIDILYYGSDVIDQIDLKIPHPFLYLRRFTLVPLVEIAPNFMHPIFQKSNQQLLQECTDESRVNVYKEN